MQVNAPQYGTNGPASACSASGTTNPVPVSLQPAAIAIGSEQVQRLGQLGLEMRQSRRDRREIHRRSGVPPLLWRCPAGCRQAFRCGDGRADRCGEPVAATVLGPDELAVLAERLAQREDLNLQIVLSDDDAGPDAVLQLVLGDERPIGL